MKKAGLTDKQRVKVNAALSLIHGQGGNADAVTNHARAYMGQGLDARAAYERAINAHVQQKPGLQAQIAKVLKVVEASDAPTIAGYDKALKEYIATGKEEALAPIMPTFAHDSVHLAQRNGELPSGKVTAEAVQTASGLPINPTVIGYKAKFTTEAPATAQIPGQDGRSRSAGAGVADDLRGPSVHSPASQTKYSSQIGLGHGPTGYVAPRTAARWNRAGDDLTGGAPTDPRASMTRAEVAQQIMTGNGGSNAGG